jgi:hypothetical protein
MTWDLTKALHLKAEFETARLLDFEFRQRARAVSLFAKRHGIDPHSIVGEIAEHDDAGMISLFCDRTGLGQAEAAAAYDAALKQARQQLVAERGDPAPHRMA